MKENSLEGKVIEVLDLEHGQKVKKFFEDYEGDKVDSFSFNCTREGNNQRRYYGVENGIFNNFAHYEVIQNGLEIIELPKEKLPIPRMVILNNSHNHEVELIADLSEYEVYYPYVFRYLSKPSVVRQADSIKEIEEMTLEQVCKELGRTIKIIE